MGTLTDLTNGYWNGTIAPEHEHPFAPRFALEEVAPGVAFVSAFANVTAFATDDGLVLADTGSQVVASVVHELVRGWSARPAHTAVYTHGHIDHVFGTALFEAEHRPKSAPAFRVVAHEAVPTRFDRYQLTEGYNACINSRQFQTRVEWPKSFRYPDETFRSQRTLEIGGRTFELHHARGETDDHTWGWVPDARTLCTGDLFIWASPNAGNPQKVQRYPREWAQALRAMALHEPEVMCPGHGPPIVGAARVKQALEETADFLESIVEQTLALMNQGATLDEVLAGVHAPEALLARPYLRPIYDEPEFIVRNVWRQFGGWFDGDPSHLKPARAGSLAAEISRLAGGARPLAERAAALDDDGEHALACHLAEFAARAAPNDKYVVRVRREIYERRAERETSLMARGIYRAAAGRRPGS